MDSHESSQVVKGQAELTNKQVGVLLLSILIVALCGIAYELIISTISSYLLGNSVYQFSFTIGLFMFAMGIGSYMSKWVTKDLVHKFVLIEIWISLIGGVSSILLFLVFPHARALYTAVMSGLILIIGTLVGLEIPILTRLLSKKATIRNSIANVLSLDYIGGLLGSLLFPLLLLPQLGMLQSSFAIALANIFIAIFTVYAFAPMLPKIRMLKLFCFTTLLLLSGLIMSSGLLTQYAEQQLYFDQILFHKQTPYQRVILTKSVVTDEHRMYLDGHIQFAERDEYRYHESLVHPTMALDGSRKNVLILGGGDGMVAREVLKYPDVESIDLVDIDTAVTELSRNMPAISKINKKSLDNPKVTIYNEDAFAYVNQPGKLYDRVIIDLPDPHNEVLNKLYSKEFYKMVYRRMSPHGTLVSQSSSPFFTRKTFWCIESTLQAAGFKTLSYHHTVPAFGVWGFHMGTRQAEIPQSFSFNVETRYLNSEVMSASTHFGKDIARVENSPVNRLLEPRLYHLYLEELRQ